MKLRKTEMIFIFAELSFIARIMECDLAQVWGHTTDDICTALVGLIAAHDDGSKSVSMDGYKLAMSLLDRFAEHDAQPEFPGDRSKMGGDQVMLDDHVEK